VTSAVEEMPPASLRIARSRVFEPLGLASSPWRPEPESAAYSAGVFQLNGAEVRYRDARSTPKKAGQFVTLWLRSPAGPIRPFDLTDPVSLFIVGVRAESGFGQFVFPKRVLQREGVVSVGGVGGKRATRVYPPWDMAPNRQAERSQAWQGAYFLDLTPGDVDLPRARNLYASISDNIP
jgi:hypothetical protein